MPCLKMGRNRLTLLKPDIVCRRRRGRRRWPCACFESRAAHRSMADGVCLATLANRLAILDDPFASLIAVGFDLVIDGRQPFNFKGERLAGEERFRIGEALRFFFCPGWSSAQPQPISIELLFILIALSWKTLTLSVHRQAL